MIKSAALITTILLMSVGALAFDVSGLETLPIQSGGRVKPFGTFARESVQIITGSASFEGKDPTEVVISWLFLPNLWMDKKFFVVDNLKLKSIMGMKPSEKYFRLEDVVHGSALMNEFTELMRLQKSGKKLDTFYTALNRINIEVTTYQAIISGKAFRVVPEKGSEDWKSLGELKEEDQKAFGELATSYFSALGKNDPSIFKTGILTFESVARSHDPERYPSEVSMKSEILYNKLHLFRFAYVFYLIALILLTFSLRYVQSRALRNTAIGFALAGWLVHTTGFLFRCYIAGRPPVSNMYESVIWVSFGCMTFGLVLEFIYKQRYILLAACAMSTIGLIVGDSVPAVLDQTINPLEPVLRSNYWLTIHVLTITLSYAAFALATGIGNIGLASYVNGTEKINAARLKSLELFAYRSIQIGVLLLTAGTILGGVWADYSWGRFWGWDPKETWALIVDLMYLAVLHGRFSGWLRSFGTLAAAVSCFASVIMAWYGVNFVLGVGLHSYGFGGGGVRYVSSLVVLQLLYVGYAGFKHRRFQLA